MRFKYPIRGLYAIIDARYVPDDKLTWFVEEVLEGGARLIQMRDKDLPIGQRLRRLQMVHPITRAYGVPLIVNDIPELQQAVGAEGLHLGRDEDHWFDPLRKQQYNLIMGISAYQDVQRALDFALRGADYVAFGSVFPSPSEPHRRKVRREVLQQARRLLNIPIVGIGGITPDNVHEIVPYVDAVAVMSALVPAPRQIAQQIAEWFV